MQHKGGKPPHRLTEYFYVIPNEWANKSNRKCICRACMEATLATKDDVASDTDLKLLGNIKVIINRDSFWDSLTTLCNLLHPFCGALDLIQ
ncbi:19155_t:CDS:2, partial [Gigaspora rosea]